MKSKSIRPHKAPWSLVRRLTAWYACSVSVIIAISAEFFYRGLFYGGLLTAVLGSVLLIYVGNHILHSGLRPLQEIAEGIARVRVPDRPGQVRVEGLPTELAGVARSCNILLEQLEECTARFSRFSAELAHEFRMPLCNLRLGTEIALSRAVTAEYYREVLASNLEEYGYLSGVIDSLLFIAKAEANSTIIVRQPVELTEELQVIRDVYEPMAAEKSIGINVEPAQSVFAALDPTLFRRAVGNLIANALDYTPDGGTVSIRAVHNDGEIRVEVVDTGIGISPEHLPHVFDRFYRGERLPTRNSGGAGLGLSIVKAIMDLHEGSTQIHSRPGSGTRVALIFPSKATSVTSISET